MYKAMGFKEAVATRKVFLLNEETGTRETCFDDSALMGYENFSFMKQGGRYECKIKLFGRLGLPEDSDLLACTVLERRVPLGVRKLAKVQVGQGYLLYPGKRIGRRWGCGRDLLQLLTQRPDSGGQCASCQLS